MAGERREHEERLLRNGTRRGPRSVADRRKMSARVIALAALVGSAAATIELTPDNFDAEVFESGKVCCLLLPPVNPHATYRPVLAKPLCRRVPLSSSSRLGEAIASP